MARIRSVHPDICTSETMADLPAELERTFVRLWTHCDDEGRCVDNSRLIKAAIYPLLDAMSHAKLDGELDKLADRGLVVRYVVDGRAYIAIRSWSEYQHPQRARVSEIPAPPERSATVTRGVRDESASTQGDVAEGSVTHTASELGEGEGEGEGDARSRGSVGAFADEFEILWKLYPRRIDRKAAHKAYVARRREHVTGGRLLAAVECYAETVAGKPVEFVKHAATFLAKGGPWTEYEHGPPEQSNGAERVHPLNRDWDDLGAAFR